MACTTAGRRRLRLRCILKPPANNAPAPLIAAIVLNWHGLPDTRAAVASLLAQTHPRVQVIVADNGSAPAETAVLEQEFGDRIEVIRNGANLGFAGGNNRAIEQALAANQAEFVALLNNDAVAAPDWLERLVAAAAEQPSAGAFASRMVYHDRPEIIENTGIDVLSSGDFLPRARGSAASAPRRSGPVLGTCAGATMYRCSALRELGLFREDYFVNFEDVDLSLRLTVSGHACWYVDDAVVRHKLNTSVRKARDDAFRRRSIRNMTHAYWVNVPLAAAILNLPWLLATWLLAPLFAAACGRLHFAALLVAGRLDFLRRLPQLVADRRRLRGHRRLGGLAFWRRQSPCLPSYLAFLRDAVVFRRRNCID